MGRLETREKELYSWRKHYSAKNKYALMNLFEMNLEREKIILRVKELYAKGEEYTYGCERELDELITLEREIEKLGYLKKEDRVFRKNWKEKLSLN